MMCLERFPLAFDIVEFGGVFRHPFGREPVLAFGQRGARRFTGMDRPIVQNDDDGFAGRSRLGAMKAIEPFEQRDEIGAALVCEVTTVSWRETKSSAPNMAIFCAWPGASTRKSAPLFAQARAR